jgi:hypothetical protein
MTSPGSIAVLIWRRQGRESKGVLALAVLPGMVTQARVGQWWNLFEYR